MEERSILPDVFGDIAYTLGYTCVADAIGHLESLNEQLFENDKVTMNEGDIDILVKSVNPTRIYEIIYNLCDNAIRYNVNGGKVTIDIHRENNRNVIIVSDTGIGIDAKHHARIFERFYRVDKSHSKETGGTGLGLSIVKHAVMYHKGKIELESELGKGTVVKVLF